MKNTLRKRCFIGFGIVSVLGVLWHFLYDLSGQNYFVGLIAPTSESIFEHVKLVFFPVLIVTPFMLYGLFRRYPALLFGLLCGNLIGSASIPLLHYMYSGILGYNISVVDISIFYVANALTFRFAYCAALNNRSYRYNYTMIAVTLFCAVVTFVVTLNPPQIALFAIPNG